MVSIPFSGQDMGYPLPRSGWEGTPSQVWMGGYPLSGLDGVPPLGLDRGTPCQDWMGHPLVETGWRVPHPRSGWGYPHWAWMEVPCLLGDWETEQLCCRQYASCFHAGGLSCIKTSTRQTFLDTIIQTSSAQKGAF